MVFDGETCTKRQITTLSKMSPDWNPVCLLCLNKVDTYPGKLPLSQEECRVVNYLLKRFVHFTKTFFGVENADRTLNVSWKESEDVSPLKCPVFCDNCEIRVIEILEMYSELKALECKLLGRVMVLGEVMEESSKPLKDPEFPIKSLSAVAKQLETDTHYLLVELFRQKVTQKCKIKSQRILPKLVLSRCHTSCDIKMLPNGRSSENLKQDVNSDLAVFIVMYFLYRGWNLNVLPEIKFTCSPYFEIPGFRSDLRIPTRQTLNVYSTLIVLCAIGLGWNLVKILKNYPSNCTFPQRVTVSVMKQIRQWNKRRSDIKMEIANEEDVGNENSQESPAYSPSPSSPSNDDSDYEEPSVTRRRKTNRRKFTRKASLRKVSAVLSLTDAETLSNHGIEEDFNGDISLSKMYGRKPKSNSSSYRTCMYCKQKFLQQSERQSHEDICPSGPSTDLKAAVKSKLVCPVCEKPMACRQNLIKHMASHYPPTLECHLCGCKFRREDNLQEHLDTRHGQGKQLVCHICGWTSAQQHKYRFHMKEHEMAHLCSVCGKRFSRASLLKRHGRKHTGERLQCEWCEVHYRDLCSLKFHMQKNHEEKWKEKYAMRYRQRIDYKVIQPPEEGVSTSLPQSTQRKDSTQATDGAKLDADQKKDGSPGTGTPVQNGTKKRRRSHPERKKISNKRPCFSKSVLKPGTSSSMPGRKPSHAANRSCQIVEEEPNNLSIQCPDCLHISYTMCAYDDHRRETHSTDPAGLLPCNSCKQTFFTFANLFAHLSAVHENGNQAQHVCVYCSESFSNLQLYSLHRYTEHWLLPRQLGCDDETCQHTSFYPNELLLHMKSHTKSHSTLPRDVFICHKCSLPFFNEQRLRLHSLVHVNLDRTLLKTLTCDRCNFETSSVYQLASHINSEHTSSEQRLDLFPCTKSDRCQSYFYNQKSLDAHLGIHENYPQPEIMNGSTKIGSTNSRGDNASSPISTVDAELHTDNAGEETEVNKRNGAINQNRAKKRRGPYPPRKKAVKKHPCFTKPFKQPRKSPVKRESGLAAEKRMRAGRSQIVGESDNTIVKRKWKKKPYYIVDEPTNLLIHCPDCFQISYTMCSHDDHRRQRHSTEQSPDLTCDSCEMTFKTFISLFSHLSTAHEDKTQEKKVCVYCPKSYSNLQLYSLHRYTQHWALPQQLQCDDDTCQHTCFYPNELLLHMKSHTQHSSSLPLEIFSCEKCSLLFFNQQRLRIHSLVHIDLTWTLSNKYSCDRCSFESFSVYQLGSHINLEHTTSEQRLELFICKQSNRCHCFFFNQKSLDAHLSIHEKYPQRPVKRENVCTTNISFCCMYSCSTEIEFKTRSELNDHEENCPLGPSKELQQEFGTSLVCPICKLVSTKRAPHSRHFHTHFPPTWACTVCKRNFRRRDHLKHHMQKMHTKDSLLVCEICGRVAANQSEMVYHMTEHEKPHQCQECGQTFSRAGVLRGHMRRHTGERLKCFWCENSYTTEQVLKNHMKQSHEKEWKENYGKWSRERISYIKIHDKDSKVSIRKSRPTI